MQNQNMQPAPKQSFRKRINGVNRHKPIETDSELKAPTRELNLKFIYGLSKYTFIWDDTDTGSDMVCSVWKPNEQSGWFSVGDMISPVKEYPSASTTIPLIMVQPLPGQESALQAPLLFELIYSDKGSGGQNDFSIWKPIAPPGYVAIGYVAQSGYLPPSRPDFMCIREDLLTPAAYSFIFNDKESGADDDVSVFSVMGDADTTVLSGGFLAVPSMNGTPKKAEVKALLADRVLLDGIPYEQILKPEPRIVETPLLDVMLIFEKDLQFKWNDKGSGASSPTVNFYDVNPENLSSGYYSLGSGGTLETMPWNLSVVKDMSGNLENPVLKQPESAFKIWDDSGSGAKLDGSFWQMVAPEGYTALGIIAQIGYGEPDLSKHRCVRNDLLAKGCVMEKNAWNDKDSGANGSFSAWYITGAQSSSLQANLLAAYPKYETFPDQVFTLNAAYCMGHNGRFGITDTNGALLEELHDQLLLEIRSVTSNDIHMVWSDEGSGARDNIAVYAPTPDVIASGYMTVGHFGATSGNSITDEAYVIKPGFRYKSLLQPPLNFKSVWENKIWMPIAPAGFVALGVIASDGIPDLSAVWCVHEDLVIPGRPGVYVWTDAGSGEDDDIYLKQSSVSLNQINDPVQDAPQLTGTMVSDGMPVFILRKIHCLGGMDQDVPPPTRFTDKLFTAKVADKYDKIWDDTGSHGSSNATFYNPVLPPNHFFLGSAGMSNYDAPSVAALRGVIVSPLPGKESIFARPVRAVLLQSTIANEVGSFWQPIAPDGYVAMGIVVNKGVGEPDLSSYACVRSDLVRRADAVGLVWNDKKTGSQSDIAVYKSTSRWNSRCTAAGTLAAVNYYGAPVNAKAYSLCTGYIQGDSEKISPDTERILIEKYGPIINYHPDESYLPTNIDEMLKRVDLFNPNESENPIENVTREVLDQHPDWQMRLKAGADRSGSLDNAIGYVHVDNGTLYTDLQFWTLHVYNGPGTVEASSLIGGLAVSTATSVVSPMGEHEGDWETIILRFTNVLDDQGLPIILEVGFVAHGDLHWVDIDKVERQGTKVVSYSSLNGHGAYAHPGNNYSSEGKVAGLVRWRLINACQPSSKMLDLSQRYAIAARTYCQDPNIEFLESAWKFKGRWGNSTDDATLDPRKLVPFLWQSLWPLILEVYAVLRAITFFIPFLGVPLLFISTAALIVEFIPNALKTLLPRIVNDADGPKPPPVQVPFNNDTTY